MDQDLLRLGLINDDEILLDEAAIALSLLDHPGADLLPYGELLEEIESRLRAVGAEASTARQHADALSYVFAEEFGFAGDATTYDDPANADLIQVLDRRRGLPVSLSILYVAAARRLGWVANVLDVPGHVLVAVGDGAVPVIVDPFRGGVLVERTQLAAMVTAGSGGASASVRHVAALPNQAILIRLLLNQASRAERAGKGKRALELYARMTIISPGYASAWWARARLELVDGDAEAARGSLTSMLEITRTTELRERITTALASIGTQ